MANNTDCKQVVGAPIETILESFKHGLCKKTEKVVSCFYHCFRQLFIKWALTIYHYHSKDIITEISTNAFTDSVIMFTEKASAGSIYNGNAAMKTIVFSFYRNKLREYIQTEKRLTAKKQKHVHDYNEEILLLEQSEPQHAEKMYAALEEAMEQMEPTDRQIIIWRHLEEKSNEEIAQLLSITVPAATNRIYRCMQRLRNLTGNNSKSE